MDLQKHGQGKLAFMIIKQNSEKRITLTSNNSPTRFMLENNVPVYSNTLKPPENKIVEKCRTPTKKLS